jgi:hypothetical protein
LVASAAWADRSERAIVLVPSQGQEAPMRKAIKYLLSAAGMFALVHLAMAVGARAQNIENGVGVVCDSPQQVEQVIVLRTDFKSAVAEINGQNNSRVVKSSMLHSSSEALLRRLPTIRAPGKSVRF